VDRGGVSGRFESGDAGGDCGWVVVLVGVGGVGVSSV